MKTAAIEWVLWALLASGVVVGARNATRRLDDEPFRATVAAREPAPALIAYRPDSLAPVVTSRALFRFGRRPSETSYDAGRDPYAANLMTSAPPVLRPRPVLRGLIDGDTARALIEGFPGVEGSRLLKSGEALNGLRVTGIARGQVHVTGFDTTWVLMLRRPQ